MAHVRDYVPLHAALHAQGHVAEVVRQDAQVVPTDVQGAQGHAVATVRVRARQRVLQGVALDALAVLATVHPTVLRHVRGLAHLVPTVVSQDARVVR